MGKDKGVIISFFSKPQLCNFVIFPMSFSKIPESITQFLCYSQFGFGIQHSNVDCVGRTSSVCVCVFMRVYR